MLPEKLLVYVPKESWGPLCEFLGVDVPDKPFPRLNDAAEMQRRVRMLRAISLAPYALLLAGTALVLLRGASGFELLDPLSPPFALRARSSARDARRWASAGRRR